MKVKQLKTTYVVRNWYVKSSCLQKSFPKNFWKLSRKIIALGSFFEYNCKMTVANNYFIIKMTRPRVF